MEWKDATSYSRDERGKDQRVPATYEAKAGPIRLCITCSHIYYKGQWVGHAFPIFKDRLLEAKTQQDAQSELVLAVKEWVAAVASAVA